MTLEDLRTFAVAYEAKSMSEAARKLGCTQGAVAQHVRKLELELSTELFTRQRRGVAPTASGKTLYEAARAALQLLEQATEEIAEATSRQCNRLRLSVSTTIMDRILRPHLLALKTRHPDMEIDLVAAEAAETRIDAVRSGRADLAMVPALSVPKGMEQRLCREVELVLLVHEAHAMARRRRITLGELSGIRYIAQSHNSGTLLHVQSVLQASNVPMMPVIVANDAPTTNLLVELGRGETFVPRRVARILERSHRVKCVRVPDLLPLKMVWVARSMSLLPPVATDFMAVCDESAPRKLELA